MNKIVVIVFLVNILSACGGGSDGDSAPKESNEVTPSSNNIPVAKLSDSATVSTNAEVVIDGSSSTDSDGDLLTYLWSFDTLPTNSTLTPNDLSTTSLLTFTPDVDGDYIIKLIVNDGKDDSSAVTVTITSSTPNNSPQAITSRFAANNIFPNEEYNLDASNSFDPEGQSITYTWSLYQFSPEGQDADFLPFEVTTQDDYINGPVLTKAGQYDFMLIVSDGVNESKPSFHTLKVVNLNEEINLGVEIIVPSSMEVRRPYSITAANVYIRDELEERGVIPKYTWTLTEAPQGSKYHNLVSNEMNFPIVPDLAGEYKLNLLFEDNFGQSITKEVDFKVIKGESLILKPNKASEGLNVFQSKVNTPIELDLSASLSPNGLPLEYEVIPTSGPGKLSISIDRTNHSLKVLTFDSVGDYYLKVRVSDGVETSPWYLYKFVNKAENGIVPVGDYFPKQELHIVKGDYFKIDHSDDNNIVIYDLDAISFGRTSFPFSNKNNLSIEGKALTVGTYSLPWNPSGLGIIKLTDFYVYPDNTTPIAKAGRDIIVQTGNSVFLNGLGSLGLSENVLVKWDIIDKPELSLSELSNSTSNEPSFNPDVEGRYVIQLRLFEGEELVSYDHIIVDAFTEDHTFKSNAGEDQHVSTNTSLVLGSEISNQSEHDFKSVNWEIINNSNGNNSSVSLSDNETLTPTLTIPENETGTFLVELTIDNGVVESKDRVVINAYETSKLQLYIGGEEKDLPISINEEINHIPGKYDVEYELAKFYLDAVKGNFTLTNMKLVDHANVVNPVMEFRVSTSPANLLKFSLESEFEIKIGEGLNLYLKAPSHTKGEEADIEFSFTVKETGEVFYARYKYKSSN